MSLDPYAAIEISADGTWRILLPDGSSQVVDPHDIIGDRLRPTGVAGRVLTTTGMPIAGAVVLDRTASGEPCTGLEHASLTGPTGVFVRALPPGVCFVSARLSGRTTPEAEVQILEGRVTLISLVMPG